MLLQDLVAVMYSDPDLGPREVPSGWKDPRTPVIIGGEQYYKDLKHWYDDGNVVLVVQDNAFRVYQGILIKRSQVMRDMFGIPQPTTTSGVKDCVSDGQPSFEGVPIVKLDDKAAYFHLLLSALLPEDCEKLPLSENLSPRELMGVAQIAKKYEFDTIATRATNVLEKILPTMKQPITAINSRYSSYNMNLYVRIINWARICGLPQFLALPFYHLATEEWEDASSWSLKAFQTLSLQDQLRINVGRGKLQTLVAGVGIGGLGPGENCRGSGCEMRRDGPRWKVGTKDERSYILERLNLSFVIYARTVQGNSLPGIEA
ncbi:hypothetical protein FRC00_005256 [Tulasnella sp. 408]|nr:hypothetical protein FRC00_005256 [Tulasnella sp. 408]